MNTELLPFPPLPPRSQTRPLKNRKWGCEVGNPGHRILTHSTGWRFLEKGSGEATICVKRGETAEIGKEALAQLAGHPCISPQILPSLSCNIPARTRGELNPIVLGSNCHRLPSVCRTEIRSPATRQRCLSHPCSPTAGYSLPSSCLRATKKNHSSILRDLSLKSGINNPGYNCSL